MRRGLALVVMLALLLAACGDDDNDSATTAAPDTTAASDTTVACDAYVALDHAFNIDQDPEAGTAALQQFVGSAPDEVAAQVRPFLDKVREDPETALDSEESAAAETAADDFAYDNCGDTTVDVRAVDFAYDGVPKEIPSGRVVFALTNASASGEFHEALLLRKADGVDRPAADLLAGAEGATIVDASSLEAALPELSMVSVGFAEPEGGRTRDVFSADLEPGNYVLACLLPVDSPDQLDRYFAGDQEGMVRHFSRGMFAEFTVT